MTSNRQHTILRSASLIIICLCIWTAGNLIDWVMIADQIAAINYEPTPEIARLREDLRLTPRATAIFAATQPSVKDDVAFNQACNAVKYDGPVIGCYDGKHIHVYNIDHPSLAGIKQSTLAHELLHAAWSRLSTQEQQSLAPSLEWVYYENFTSLEPRLKLYTSDKFHNELHSLIGTEITSLPASLSSHYAKYFTNQSIVVSFYDQYEGTLQALKAEAEALFAQIEINQALIEAKSANYDEAATLLSAAIADFNRRAESGAFSSIAAYNAEYAALIARQQELNRLYQEIVTLVETTNRLIEEYNHSVARNRALLDSINSQPPPPQSLTSLPYQSSPSTLDT